MKTFFARDARLALAIAVITALAFLPTLGGYFLSDDFSYVFVIHDAFARGEALNDVARQFSRGLTSGGDYYYRPLAYASFALDYLFSGPAPFAYRLSNLFLHAANAGMVATLFLAICRQTGLKPSLAAAALAGLLFGLFPSSLEVVSWVSGRFDALATFFLLLTLIFFIRTDRWRLGAPISLILALMSKESAILAVVYAALLAMLADSGTSLSARIRHVGRRLLPLLLLATAYFCWRWLLFGAPFKVRIKSNALPDLLSGAWLHTLSSWPDWFRVLTNDSASPFLTAALAGVILAIVAAWRDDRLRRLLMLCTAALFIAYAMVFANNPSFVPDGRNGRLFYQLLIPASWLLALPLAFFPARQSAKPLPRLRFSLLAKAYAIALIAALIWLACPAVAAWRDAGEQAESLRDALASEAAATSPGQYVVVFAPEYLGNIPFVLNAQGGFVLPPFQPLPLTSRLILQTESEFASFTQLAEAGLVTRLKREKLAAIARGEPPQSPLTSIDWPEQYRCWRSDRQSLKPMAIPAFRDRDSYVTALEKAYSTCLAAP